MTTDYFSTTPAHRAFLSAHAAYFCAQSARRHARTLTGTSRRECYMHAREMFYSARRHAAAAADALGLMPPKEPTLNYLIGLRGWTSDPAGRGYRKHVRNAHGALLIAGTAYEVWQWYHSHRTDTSAPCPFHCDERAPVPKCLNCNGRGVVYL